MKFNSLILLAFLLFIGFSSCNDYDDQNEGCRCSSEYQEYLSDDYEYQVRIPNIFSPNNDGLNDFFSIYSEGVESLQVNIYDGTEEIFSSNEVNFLWDGKVNEQLFYCKTFDYTINVTFNNGIEKTFESTITCFTYQGKCPNNIDGCTSLSGIWGELENLPSGENYSDCQ